MALFKFATKNIWVKINAKEIKIFKNKNIYKYCTTMTGLVTIISYVDKYLFIFRFIDN